MGPGRWAWQRLKSKVASGRRRCGVGQEKQWMLMDKGQLRCAIFGAQCQTSGSETFNLLRVVCGREDDCASLPVVRVVRWTSQLCVEAVADVLKAEQDVVLYEQGMQGSVAAELEVFGDNKVEDRKPCMSDAQGQSNNNNTNKHPSNDDYSSIFDISDVIALDPEILSALGNTAPQPHQASNTGTGQQYSNLSQIPMSIDPMPVPVPFSQTPSPRDRPATTSTVFTIPNPSPQYSQVHASPVTPTGTYLGRTTSPRWNQTYQSQAPPMTTPYTSRKVSVPVTSQSPANVSSFVQSQHVPRVLSQPNNYGVRGLTSSHASTSRQHPSGPTVQSVSRLSDLVDVDLTVPDTSNWRPRMRGSLVPGSHSTALDHMIIRPSQQSQTSTRLNSSQPVQTPSVQTSQAQSPFTTAAYRTETVLGNRNHPVPAPPGIVRPTGPTS